MTEKKVENVAPKTTAKEKTDGKLVAAVRIRGSMQTRFDVEDTLKQLHLNRKNNCSVLMASPTLKGMLQKAKDYITWGEIDAETLEMLLEKKGEGAEGKKLNEALSGSEHKTIALAAKSIADGKANLKKLGLKSLFRLQPPKGGFKGGIKHDYPKGALGKREKKDITALITKMIY